MVSGGDQPARRLHRPYTRNGDELLVDRSTRLEDPMATSAEEQTAPHALEEVSQYREDRLRITFTENSHRPGVLLVKLADTWTGLSLRPHLVNGERQWLVEQRPDLGTFRVRGEAVAAAMVTTFDPD